MAMAKSYPIGREVFEILKETVKEWQNDNASQVAAGVAFYAVLSAAPLLLVVIAIASFVFGREASQSQLIAHVQAFMGEQGARVVQTLMSADRTSSYLDSTVGLLTMLFGATAMFVNLQDALNNIWEVTPKPGRILMPFIRKRLLSFAMVIGCGLLLLLSLFASAALSVAENFTAISGTIAPSLLHVANFVLSLTVLTAVFGIIFKTLPDVRISWRDVWVGGCVTSLLFTIGKSLAAVYLVHSSIGSFYGAAGSIVVLLAWIYYSAQTFFFGAEFTQVYARRYSSGIEPDENAVRFTREIKA